jgi:c-di-GMP-binding flagellar brake protein YcgR
MAMSTAKLAESPEKTFEENLEKFQVYSPLEMARLFRNLQTSRQLLRMSFAGTLETFMTHVLDVDLNKKTILLDAPSIPAQMAIALRSNVISVEGVLDRIKISFTVAQVHQEVFEGEPAFRVTFPERLLRLQRREHFRVPVSNSTVHIPIDLEGSTIHLVGSVRDLSSSGACVMDASMMMDNTIGKVYQNCCLILPETQPLVVALEIRNSHEIAMPDNSQQRRIGCQFINLSSSESALIQRYITRLERQQRMLTG